jgi:hypothetical protein
LETVMKAVATSAFLATPISQFSATMARSGMSKRKSKGPKGGAGKLAKTNPIEDTPAETHGTTDPQYAGNSAPPHLSMRMTRTEVPTTTSNATMVINPRTMKTITTNIPTRGGPVPDERDMGDCTQRWLVASQKSGRCANTEVLARDVANYVRYELFPKLKFITGEKQMMYSKDVNSFCAVISASFGLHNVDEEVAVRWWENHKKQIQSILNQKRADVTAGIKGAFWSK